MNLADSLAHHVTARPDRPALIEGERVILYRDLDGKVRRWAAHLRALGVRQGDVLGIALHDRIEHVLALYAAARMGAIALPMDWRWTETEKSIVARHFRAAATLVESDSAGFDGPRAIVVDDAFTAATEHAQGDEEFPSGDAARDMPLLMSLSSGTTGRPKGPVLTHHQFLRRFWTHWIDLGLNSREVFVSATPMYFGGGRTFAMSLLFSGGTVCLFPPPFKPADLVAEVALRSATSAFLVPTQLRRLLELSDDAAAPLRAMRLLLSSGAPLTPFERRGLRDRLCAGFHEYYASTEGGGISLLRPEDLDAHPDSVGRPVFGVEVAVFDDDGVRLPLGSVGRLAYRGPGVARGFFDDPEADAETFVNGFFFPGDLGVVDESGFVALRGRRKDMIIRGGINIYPMEIESILLGHGSVAEAAVVGWPSRDLGEEVAAFVLPRGAADPDALRALCAARLAPYKVPRAVIITDDLPRNSSGKVLKAALVARLQPL